MSDSASSLLACSVRGCGKPLTCSAATWRCDGGHSFDTARSGYLNLIQPQDRRSLDAGDRRETVAARRALLDSGFGTALGEALFDALASLSLPCGARALDLGCGDGHYLAALCARAGLEGCGIDLSVPAVDAAARRHPEILWVAANADRRLPLLGGAFDLALSIDGRRPCDELARVLKPGGHLVVAIPGANDLIELRGAVLAQAHTDDRVPRVEADLAPHFRLIKRQTVEQTRNLDRTALSQLAATTYRCARRREQEVFARLDDLSVTTAHDVLVFVSDGALDEV